MIQLYDINHNKIAGLTNYKDLNIQREINQLDILSFSYPVSDKNYSIIQEECYIRTKDNEYVVKEVNTQDDDWTQFVCKVNIEDIKGTPVSQFEIVEQTCLNAVNLALIETGWTTGNCNVTKLRTVRKNNCNAYDVLQEIQSAYSCEMTFDSISKQVNLYQSMGTDKGTYFAEQLNLKKLDVQRNSYDYITRLIPIGKDGLDITSVNSGKNYVENYQYSNKIISAYWEDNRYTVAEDLLEDATERLDYLSKPYKAYNADVFDLANNSDIYKNILDYSLGDTITLLSKSKNTKEKQRIVKLTEYPEEAEKNTVEIANKIVSLDVLNVRFQNTSDTVDQVTTSDGMVDGSKVDSIDWGQLQNVSIKVADIQDMNTVTGSIGKLEANTAHITNGIIDNAKIEAADVNNLSNNYAHITNGLIDNAQVNTAQIANGAIATLLLKDEAVDETKIKKACIYDALIKELDADKIKSGHIYTNLVTIQSPSGNMLMTGDILQIKDTSRVRVQIGKDAGNDYNMYVWDASGNLMFDATGLKKDGIKDKIIVDNMVSDTANIDAKKLDIDSLFYQMNNSISTIPLDNADSSLIYTGTWETESNSGYYGGTAKYSNIASDNIQFTFTGTGINLYFTKAPTMGICEIFLDSVSQGTFDIYSSSLVFKSKVFSITNLTNGDHTIQINVTGTKNASSSNSYIELDYLEYITPYNSSLLNASKIKLDTQQQTLDLSFTSLSDTVSGHSDTIKNQGKYISALQGNIQDKVWQTDITTYSGISKAVNSAINGNFSNGTNNWAAMWCSMSTANNVLSATGTSGGNNNPYVYQNVAFVTGHKYYLRATVKVTNSICTSIAIDTFPGSNLTASQATPAANQDYVLSAVGTTSTESYIRIFQYYTDAATAVGKVMQVKEVTLVDLTSVFGPGYEPSKDWCDVNLTYTDVALSTQSQLNTTNNNINNIQIGGRNLLLGTKDFNTSFWNANSAGVTITSGVAKAANGTSSLYTARNISDIPVLPNTQYTISVKAKTDNVNSLSKIFFNINQNDAWATYIDYSVKNTSWQVYTYTFTTKNVSSLAISIGNPVATQSDGYSLFWKEAKFELGNKATDYTPAPEDVQSYTDNAVSNIQVGGRNLLINSGLTAASLTAASLTGLNNFFYNGTTVSGTIAVVDESAAISGKAMKLTLTSTATGQGGMYIKPITNNAKSLVVGKTYTISGYVKCSRAITAFNVAYEGRTGDWTQFNLPANTWTYFTHTFTVGTNDKALHFYDSDPTYMQSGDTMLWHSLKLEEGNKATTWTYAPEDVDTQITKINGNYSSINQTVNGITTTVNSLKSTSCTFKVRYIRDWLNGNTINTSGCWTEISAMQGKNNLAVGKTVTSDTAFSTGYNNLATVTDGNTVPAETGNPNSTYCGITTAGAHWVQVDLGSIYDNIDYIQIWHYYLDGRTFHGTKTQVSADGVNWTTLFDSTVSGEYPETSSGNIINVNLGNIMNRLSSAESQIQQYSDNISSYVTKNGLGSLIQQSSDNVRIAFNAINSASVTIDTTGLTVNKGKISADALYGGTLTLGGTNNANGVLTMENSSGDVFGSVDSTGITMNAPLTIGGDYSYTGYGNCTYNATHKSVYGLDSIINEYLYSNPGGEQWNFGYEINAPTSAGNNGTIYGITGGMYLYNYHGGGCTQDWIDCHSAYFGLAQGYQSTDRNSGVTYLGYKADAYSGGLKILPITSKDIIDASQGSNLTFGNPAIYITNTGEVRVGTNYTDPWTNTSCAIKAGGNIAAKGYLYSDTGNGTIQVGSQNTGYCHYVTDRPKHWFNQTISTGGALEFYPYGASLGAQSNGSFNFTSGHGNNWQLDYPSMGLWKYVSGTWTKISS